MAAWRLAPERLVGALLRRRPGAELRLVLGASQPPTLLGGDLVGDDFVFQLVREGLQRRGLPDVAIEALLRGFDG